MLLDFFAETHSLNFKPSKFDYYFAQGSLSDSSYILVKPTTYVNNSGIAVIQIIKKYNLDIKDFLVVYDDFNLEFAKLRVRLAGGDGGHNGLASIIYNLNSDEFPRLRIGIGNDFKTGEMTNYVLTDFNENEQKVLTDSFNKASVLLEEFITGGINKMLDVNSRLSHLDNNQDF